MRPHGTKQLYIVLAAILILGATTATAQTRLESAVVGSGGGEAAGNHGQVRLTIGQTVIGTAADYHDQALLGFWHMQWMKSVSTVPDGSAAFRNRLDQNAPNPFNPRTTIGFSLEKTAAVRLEVFDLRGRRVALLLDETMAAGEHTLVFQPDDLASGVYLLRLHAGGFDAVRRFVLLK